MLLLTSACHGVEGFCGSGVQGAALHDASWRALARERGVAVREIDEPALVPALRHDDLHPPPGAVRQVRLERLPLVVEDREVVVPALLLVGFETERLQYGVGRAGVPELVLRHCCGGDGGLRLGAGVDHGDDDAVGAVVEDALDVVVAVGRDAGQGGAAGVGDGGEHVGGGLPVDEAVLDVDGEPGEARAGQEARGGDAAQGQPGADGRLAGPEGLLDRVGAHGAPSG